LNSPAAAAAVSVLIQEMAVRLGIATGKGHAAMICQRFGRWWGMFSLVDLQRVNFLTLVTEFAAISLALSPMNIAPRVGVPLAAVALVVMVVSGSYRRWDSLSRDRPGRSFPTARALTSRESFLANLYQLFRASA
jgi:Mn2+/Fe2+ NRAMP family transporter